MRYRDSGKGTLEDKADLGHLGVLHSTENRYSALGSLNEKSFIVRSVNAVAAADRLLTQNSWDFNDDCWNRG